MRAPDTTFIDYSTTAWAAIEASLPGINLDKTIVSLVLRNISPARKRSLRDALRGLAQQYSGAHFRPLTPKQRAVALRRSITRLKAARAAFDEVGYGFEGHFGTVGTELNYWIGEWQRRLNELTAMGNRGTSGNARKPHIQYWTRLRRMWLAITADTKQQPKALHHFLLACSEPLFPTATNDKALTSFIERAASLKQG